MKANLDKFYKKEADEKVSLDFISLIEGGYTFQSTMKYLTSKEYLSSTRFKKLEFGKEAVVETLKKGIELVLVDLINKLEANEGIPAINSYEQILSSENFSDCIFKDGDIPEYFAKQIKEYLRQLAERKVSELEKTQPTVLEEEPTFYEAVKEYTNGFQFLTTLPEIHEAGGRNIGRKMNTENGFRFIKFRDDLKTLQISNSLVGESVALNRYIETNQGELSEDEIMIIKGRLSYIEGELARKQPGDER